MHLSTGLLTTHSLYVPVVSQVLLPSSSASFLAAHWGQTKYTRVGHGLTAAIGYVADVHGCRMLPPQLVVHQHQLHGTWGSASSPQVEFNNAIQQALGGLCLLSSLSLQSACSGSSSLATQQHLPAAQLAHVQSMHLGPARVQGQVLLLYCHQ
jgi:hypothetical protein